MPAQGQISENSRRIAKNTLFLYFRMFLMMVIGLFTSRVVLKALGVADLDTYNSVGGIVMMFTVISNSVSQAISRYITSELGKGDKDKLRRIFSTSVVIQIAFCVLLLILTETLGLWYLNCRMKIPEGRLPAANLVLQCSMGVLMLNILSIPFNAVIIAREKMDAFAAISIVEALLKLSVALALYFSAGDKLRLYAVLLLSVAFIVRLAYGLYCKKFFEESRGRLVLDRSLIREMSAFAGWNFFGSAAYVVNIQGVTLLCNFFFGGLGVNAARGLATQVEGVIRQFVGSTMTAINPQIIKSYVSGGRDYSFELVCKGVKYTLLIMLVIAVPLLFEAPLLMDLWLDEVPAYAVLFVRLMLLSVIAEMIFNPLLTLIQADGRIRRYYIVSSLVSILAFALSWVAFRLGAPAYAPYLIFAVVYLGVNAVRLVAVRRLAGFPVGRLLSELALRVLPVALLSAGAAFLVWRTMPYGWVRTVAVICASTAVFCISAYFLALTDGERGFVKSKLSRHGA